MGQEQVAERVPQEELSYEGEKGRVVQFLESKHAIALATSLEGRVTARTVSFANDGLDIIFWSWGHNVKCVQIRGNPRVALCRDHVQIEGVAEILGSPLDEKNERYTETMRRKYPGDYDRFAHAPGMVIVRVIPTLVRIFVQIDGAFYLKCLDLDQETAYLEALAG